MLCSQKRVCKHRVLSEGPLYHATRSYSRSQMSSFLIPLCLHCLPSSMPGPSSPYNVIRHWRYQAGNGEERDITCFHRACLTHSHDMPCRHPRVPQRQMHNTGSGVPISTGSCCHQPALLHGLEPRTTPGPHHSSLILLLWVLDCQVSPKYFPAVSQRGSPKSSTSSRIFSHLPMANNSRDFLRLVIKEQHVALESAWPH